MVHFFIGTGAELIKVMPVMLEMRRRGLPYRYVDSGQHARTTRWLREDFELGEPDFYLDRRETNVASLGKGIVWLAGHILRGKLRRGWLRREVFPGKGIVLVHGDTASTLTGTELACAAGLAVGHVEAGLRSFNIFSPFPEELIRIHCSRKFDLLFPPNPTATDNLRRMRLKGRVIESGGNTIVDALRMALAKTPSVEIPKGPFALAAIHRMETITSADKMRRIIALLHKASRKLPVVFIKYPAMQGYLDRFKLEGELSRGNIRVIPMLPHYYDFIAMEQAATVVLADGCGVQEECSLFNKPYLILRNATERDDGLGRTAVLWKGDDAVAEKFLEEYPAMARNPAPPWSNPSARIVDALVELGYCRD